MSWVLSAKRAFRGRGNVGVGCNEEQKCLKAKDSNRKMKFKEGSRLNCMKSV